MESRIGSLTPGKQADVIVIGGRRLNMVPMADPVGCIVAQANPHNVRHVLVAGRFAKRDGELVGIDLDRAIALVQDSSERVLERVRGAGADGASRYDTDSLLAPVPDDFATLLNTLAAQNLARAWSIEPSR